MRVLVTGGAGYIGSHTCKALNAAGHEPIAYDNLSTGDIGSVKWGPFHHGDICDPLALADVFRSYKPDAVIHFAAKAYVGESMALPGLYYRTNVLGSIILLESMRLAQVRNVVFSSSCATYGVPASSPISEDCPQVPINPYGRSKLMVEQIFSDYTNAYGFGCIALRYFNAAGADRDGDIGESHCPETHLIPLALQVSLGIVPKLTIYGDDYDTHDGTCVRDFVHVEDLAIAHVKALECVRLGSFRAFNLGTGLGTSVQEILDAIYRTTGRRVNVEIGRRRPGDPAELVADPSRAKAALDWHPRHTTVDPMIRSAWQWMKKTTSLSDR